MGMVLCKILDKALLSCYNIFSAKNISTLDFRHTRRLNESLTNDFVKLTMLWTTGPSFLAADLEISA